MTQWRGSNEHLSDTWTLALGLFGILLWFSLAGILVGLNASDTARFSLSVAGQHLRSAWECVIYALQVW